MYIYVISNKKNKYIYKDSRQIISIQKFKCIMQLYKYLMDQIQTSDVKRVLVRQFIPIMQDDAIDIWRWKMFGMSAEYSTLHYSSLYNLLIIWNIEWIKWSLCETPLALTLPKYYHQSCPKEVSIEKLLKGAWLTHFLSHL